MLNISKTKLDNGLKVIVIEMPDFHSVSSGIYIKAGSRYERKLQAGVSHFLEHLVFKGTEKYENSLAVSRAIEEAGGQLNGRTGQDITSFFNGLPKRHYQKGLEVLAELTLRPKMREKDIEKERPVILEEVKMYRDLPQDHVHELLIKLMGEGHSLGRIITGTEKSVQHLKRDDFRKCHHRFYRTANMVLVVAGPVKREDILSRARVLFATPVAQKRIKIKEDFRPKQNSSRVKLEYRKTKQAHLCLGIYGYGYDDPKRYPWFLLNAILGEGMGSRLFEEIREKRGLCYAIYSSKESVKEIGFQVIYAGLKIHRVEEGIRAILNELRRIREEGVSERELKRAREMKKGEIDLNLDDANSISDYFGETELHFREKLSPIELKERLDRVSREDIKEIAREIFQDNRLNLAILGPYRDKEKFKNILKLEDN